MHYKDGLNVDVVPFYPHGDCQTGGIYFAREDILGFLSYGVWIREVTLPEGEEVYENPGHPKKWKAHSVILGPRRRVGPQVIMELIKEGADITDVKGSLVNMAVNARDTEFLQFLIEKGVVRFKYEHLTTTILNKDHDMAEMILKSNWVDIHTNCELALRDAADVKDPKMVKLLIDHGANYKKALQRAQTAKSTRAAQFLLKNPPPPKPKTALFKVIRVAHAVSFVCALAIVGYVIYTLVVG